MSNKRTSRLLLLAAVAVATTAGASASAAASAASPPGAANQAAAVTAGWTHVPGSGYITNSSACMVGLWTSQVSAGDPAYIAAQAFQLAAPYPCKGMVQLSADGGKTWTSGTPVTVPASATLVTFFANTGAAYDGPGHLGRACATTHGAPSTVMTSEDRHLRRGLTPARPVAGRDGEREPARRSG